ncbi:MAG: 3-oxoacyl-[acyl-carrier-protein] synthase 2 [Bacteroidia bacterium]|nr:3-oxoacyl-[acyl-carrier-protein] synthase 2 [Bacteroidia bacterium]
MKPVFTAQGNVLSSLGFTAAENFTAMQQGRSGIKKHSIPEFLSFPFYASLIDNEKLKAAFFPFIDNNNYTRLEKIFILSIADVLQQTGLNPKDEKTLLVISTTKGNINLLELENYGDFSEKRLLLSEMAKVIADFFGMKNTPLVVSNACISGVLAIISAQRLISSGQYENVIVSGGDLVSEFTLSGFNSFKAMSDEPCRPYDAERKGISLGEGCGTLLLTSNETLLRKAEKKITVAGCSVSNDANHISGPSRTGEELALAVNIALAEAEVGKSVDFISAHGTATLFNDEMESKAFFNAGLNHIPLNSMKGFFGHTLGAAGVIEAVVTLESINRNMLLPSHGFENLGVPAPLNIIKQNVQKEINTALKTASGFGGCNAAVVFKAEK